MALSVLLRLGDTNTYDVSLTSSGVAMTEFPMGTPDLSNDALSDLGDGDTLGITHYSNVTESLEVHVSAASASLVADKLRAIERLLDIARVGTTGELGDKVYLVVQFDHDAGAWRSQILAARLESLEGTDQIWRKYVKATLYITRRYFWERETLQSVEVSSGSTAATTGYATIYNGDDVAPQRNWFDIAAAQVTGSLPAPARISIKNTSGSTSNFSAMYLGNYVFSGSGTVNPVFRAETSTIVDTTPGDTEQEIYSWAMGSLADAFKGQAGHFVVAWSDRPATTTLVRALVDFRFPIPTFPIALGEAMLGTGDAVMDLGSLPIPPIGAALSVGTKLALTIHAKAASGTDTLGIDWLQIFPGGTGRYRVIKGITTYSIANNEEVIDDGPAGAVYAHDGTALYPVFRPFFEPIHLWPGRDQRLRFVVSGGTSVQTGKAWGARVEYRPRRLSF